MVLLPETRIDTAMATAITIPMTATITFITSAPQLTDFIFPHCRNSRGSSQAHQQL